MSKPKTGGPAFPLTAENIGTETLYLLGEAVNPGVRTVFGGISIRDYFAAKAMAAFIVATADDTSMDIGTAFNAIATMAYRQADAMLEARKS